MPWSAPTPANLEKIGMAPHDANFFIQIFERHAAERAKINNPHYADRFNNCKPPSTSHLLKYDQLKDCPPEKIPEFLSKVVVIKLNGGLGTSMGLPGPKSTIELRKNMTFLDLTVKQLEHLYNKYKVQVPLVLMNSFHTDKETKKILQRYENRDIKIYTFNQTKFPRVTKDTGSLGPKNSESDTKFWYPPGSGNVFDAFFRSGLLEDFINQGKDYAFVSNIENLGGVLGHNTFRLLNEVMESQRDFILEVTERIPTDLQGGILIQEENQGHKTTHLRLLELSQVPIGISQQFKASEFKYWNTNSMWVSLRAWLKAIKEDQLKLRIVSHTKEVDGGSYVQLECPAASAIQSFEKSVALIVPRQRFREVKTTAGLFLLQSNLVIIDEITGLIRLNPVRGFDSTPNVKFGEHFSNLNEYHKRFKSIPEIVELDHLTVSGNVYFGSGIKIKGTVIIVANDGERIDIPDNAEIENKIIAGNLSILDH